MVTKRYPRTILASAVIPWTESYELDETLFRREIRSIRERGISHLYLFGTAGEGHAVNDSLFELIVDIFAEETRGPGLYPMVGVISLSLPVMIERIKKARDRGIRDFQISLPSWGELSEQEICIFFHHICDTFPDCRFLHYNLMRSKRLLTIGEYEKLSDEVPNLVGVKFCTNDLYVLRDIAGSACPLQFFVSEAALGYGSLFGECGLLISVGNCNIKRTAELFAAVTERNLSRAAELTRELMMVHKGLSLCCTGKKIDGAYDKMYAKLIDPEFPLRLLPPYTGFTDEVFQRYREYLRSNCPDWLEPQNA